MNFLDYFKPKKPTYDQCVKSTELLALEAKYRILSESHEILQDKLESTKSENLVLHDRVQELESREKQFTKFAEIVQRMFEACGEAIDSLPEDLNRPLEENKDV